MLRSLEILQECQPWKLEPYEHAGPCDWQAGYGNEKRNVNGGVDDSNTLLPGNRQVMNCLLSF